MLMEDFGLLHRGRRIILLFLMISLISYLIFFLNTGIRKMDMSGLKEGRNPIGEADTEVDNFSFFQTKDGKVEWEIKAVQAELFKEESRLLLKDVKITINSADGMKIFLAGDNGSLNTESKDFQISKIEKDIRLELGNGLAISSSSLRWINEKREIISDSPVDIRGAGMIIKGNHFVANLDSQQFEVSGDVETYLDK